MNLIYVTALLCAGAGLLMMILGFVLTWAEMRLRAKVQNALEGSSNAVSKVGSKEAHATITGAAELTKALAELAKNLKGLTPAVASFIIATILFFFSASLAAITYVVK
jgi:hypothetical protein